MLRNFSNRFQFEGNGGGIRRANFTSFIENFSVDGNKVSFAIV